MHKIWTQAGLPASIGSDGWWLDAPPPRRSAQAARGPGPRIAACLAGLVVLGDWLFYGHPAGLSLALFGAAVLGAAMLAWPVARPGRGFAIYLLAALPVVEHVQLVSVLFLLVGLVVALGVARAPTAWAAMALRLGRVWLWLGVRDGVRALVALARRPVQGGAPGRVVRGWALPLGGGAVLTALLLEANPILSRGLSGLSLPDLSHLIPRALFWGGLALMVWPALARLPDATPPVQGPRRPFALPGLNAPSALRALVLFNAVLGVQSVMDLGYLWAGADLPQGMSHATYARRGAYPLLATALLAGGFALATRPFQGESRMVRALVLLWLGQNLLLVASSGLRLLVYVQAYGLTYLRFHAGVWMGLVALGLALTLWQVRRGRSNGWLLRRCAGMGLATVYALCFLNVAQVIATHNLNHPVMADRGYLCRLGPMAAPALQTGATTQTCRAAAGPAAPGWRDWGFRTWRVRRMLAEKPVPEPVL